MAKSGFVLHGARGKIGQIVAQNGPQGGTTLRELKVPKNPKTTPQMLQRMCMAQATKLGAFFSSFVDHSFQNKQYGGPSRNYFVKRAVQTIRMRALAAYQSDDDIRLYQPKAFPYAAMFEVPFSEGTLLPLQAIKETNAAQTNRGFAAIGLNVDTTGANPAVTAEDLFTALNVPDGGQLTLITVVSTGTVPFNGGYDSDSEQLMPLPAYKAIRMRINKEMDNPAKLELDTALDIATLEAAGLIVETEGAATDISLFICYDDENDIGSVVFDHLIEDGVGTDAIAIVGVISLFDGGKWLRSSQDIVITDQWGNFANALNSWTDSNATLLNTSRLLNYEGLVNP